MGKIISASRRTDIPCFYGKWFYNRVKDGKCSVQNPYYPQNHTIVSLTPQDVECFVFWTKHVGDDFLPCMELLNNIGYKYYFQYTFNYYGREIEKNLPSQEKRMGRMIELAMRYSPNIIRWRYDPIFISNEYSVTWHIDKFDFLSGLVSSFGVKYVTISFGDWYEKLGTPLSSVGMRCPTEEEMECLGRAMGEIAKKYGMTIASCCEKVDMSKYGIIHGACVDREFIQALTGSSSEVKKGRKSSGREMCECAMAVDIGVYNSCRNGCIYCYASSPSHQGDVSMDDGPMNEALKENPSKGLNKEESFNDISSGNNGFFLKG